MKIKREKRRQRRAIRSKKKNIFIALKLQLSMAGENSAIIKVISKIEREAVL